ncbi:MAG TPA: methyltransferase domain-containing protein [Methylomirabilota bacterium]|jgi:SAM-dependent methyltransferase|nr:methyltransferase domain-containing protein [Methylomirabilota bacterium]
MSEGPSVSEPAFWRGLYERGGDRWDLGRPTPPLVEYLARHRLPGERVAVPGCGRGHDARAFARIGFHVWGFDFAPQAIGEARTLAAAEGLPIVFEERDVFGLAADYAGFFDGVWEYTSYCAIDPARRPEYVRLVRTLLKPDGWLLACFFPVREGAGGPPFPTTEAEVRRLFTPAFTLEESHVPRSSAAGRQGIEWFVVARARPLT